MAAMSGMIVHRGPDEGGSLLAPGVALGMRRLSIIDLAGSHQPVSNERGSVQAVFNGEIFNYRELRQGLIARGHLLATEGDGETLVHLYEEHGHGFVSKLRGMFAIALWDQPEHRLLLARDRLGVKPLYYARIAGGLAFASEVKSLLAGGLVEPKLDLQAAELFLTLGYVPGDRTLFAGVRKLPPATVLEFCAGKLLGPREYWTPWSDSPQARGSWEEDRERLLELLRTAVRARMISDVPLGVMLSGGLDSSLIAALMAEASPQPVETFSIGFSEDANANELTWARRTAQRIGSHHHELLTSASEHEDLLDHALWHLEEPIADLSFLGFRLLSRLARETVTVALCGQAADELLGGYPKHRAAHLAGRLQILPDALRAGLWRTAGTLDGRSRLGRMLGCVAAPDDLSRLLAMSQVITPALRESLAGSALDASPAKDLLVKSVGTLSAPPAGSSLLTRTLALDLRTALPDLMFLYFDKMSMAESLEVRVPFADHDLVSFCMSLPDDRRIRRGRGKELLREISRDLVDEAIIERPKRGFFRAASSSWLVHQRALVEETLLDARCAARGLLDPAGVRSLLQTPQAGGRGGEPLLIAFLLERWHRLFVDHDGLGAMRTREISPSAGVTNRAARST